MRSKICSDMVAFRRMPTFVVILVLMFFGLGVAVAAEQDKSPAGSKAEAGVKNPVKKDVKSAVPQEKVKGEELEISVKAPQAYYIMPRSNLNIEGLELNESFIPKIIKSVEEEPF